MQKLMSTTASMVAATMEEPALTRSVDLNVSVPRASLVNVVRAM